jgi:hypothetical protein
LEFLAESECPVLLIPKRGCHGRTLSEMGNSRWMPLEMPQDKHLNGRVPQELPIGSFISANRLFTGKQDRLPMPDSFQGKADATGRDNKKRMSSADERNCLVPGAILRQALSFRFLLFLKRQRKTADPWAGKLPARFQPGSFAPITSARSI